MKQQYEEKKKKKMEKNKEEEPKHHPFELLLDEEKEILRNIGIQLVLMAIKGGNSVKIALFDWFFRKSGIKKLPA